MHPILAEVQTQYESLTRRVQSPCVDDPQSPRDSQAQDFRMLWAAQSVALLGSQIAFLAIPLTAVVALGATPFQMSLLAVAESLPALLLGLFAGVLVDRRRRKPLLVWSDVGRALLLALVPLAAITGLLRMELLLVVTFGMGILTVLFAVAYRSFLPAIVERTKLLRANERLEFTQSAAEVAGPGVAGVLIQMLTAPIALVVNAATFMVSGFLLGRIQGKEPPQQQADHPPVWRDIREGLRFVFSDPRLRALTGAGGVLGLFNAMLEVVTILYFTRVLGIGPALIGFAFGAGSVGFLVGALLPGRLTNRLGWGRATTFALAVTVGSDLLLPLAGGPIWLIMGMLIVAQFLFGLGLTVYRVNQISLRQIITPDHLLGRMNATMHTVTIGLAALGALAGGLVAEHIGLRNTLFLAIAGESLAVIWLWCSPLRSINVVSPVNDAISG